MNNVLLHFFLIGNGQELGIETGKCLGARFWFYIYIRTFTNVLLHFFLVISNGKKLGIKAGRCFR